MTARLPLELLGHPAADAPASGPLVDTFGRVHENLRVSVTDRCNLRCTYCMPEDVTFLPQPALLTFEEIAAFVGVAAGLGVSKVRLTGGEPLLRRDLATLARKIVDTPGVREVGVTTNGLLLARQAEALRHAGVTRLNVSLDTLDPGRFRRLARRDGLPQVLAGLEAAKRAGFARIKVNAVAIRRFIDLDLVPLATFCRERGFEFRLIEFMPIGGGDYSPDDFVPASELLDRIDREVSPLLPAGRTDPHAPAYDAKYADGSGRVGVIASVTEPFCGRCNRLRLTAEGKLRNCLFAHDEADVKPLLRAVPFDPARLAAAIRGNVWAKGEGHEIRQASFVRPARTMHAIGG